ncbi:hypothetical protein MBLNU459_g3184t1 [Dothideomycetes sp. NU459]
MELIGISSLSPSSPVPAGRAFTAIVTLLWPFSSATGQCALLLADPDFRLRYQKGQVRVRFAGASARAIAKSGIGIGDEVDIALDGARWLSGSEVPVKTPGRGLDGELMFESRVRLVVRPDGRDPRVLDVDEPTVPLSPDRTAVAPSTPAPRPLGRFSFGPDSSGVAIYSSPAYMKRLRLSEGSFVESPRLSQSQDDEMDSASARKRRRVSYKNVTQWKFDDREPSPEKEYPDVMDVVEGGRTREVEGPKASLDTETREDTSPLEVSTASDSLAAGDTRSEVSQDAGHDHGNGHAYDETAEASSQEPVSIQGGERHDGSSAPSPRLLLDVHEKELDMPEKDTATAFDMLAATQVTETGVQDDAHGVESNGVREVLAGSSVIQSKHGDKLQPDTVTGTVSNMSPPPLPRLEMPPSPFQASDNGPTGAGDSLVGGEDGGPATPRLNPVPTEGLPLPSPFPTSSKQLVSSSLVDALADVLPEKLNEPLVDLSDPAVSPLLQNDGIVQDIASDVADEIIDALQDMEESPPDVDHAVVTSAQTEDMSASHQPEVEKPSSSVEISEKNAYSDIKHVNEGSNQNSDSGASASPMQQAVDLTSPSQDSATDISDTGYDEMEIADLQESDETSGDEPDYDAIAEDLKDEIHEYAWEDNSSDGDDDGDRRDKRAEDTENSPLDESETELYDQMVERSDDDEDGDIVDLAPSDRSTPDIEKVELPEPFDSDGDDEDSLSQVSDVESFMSQIHQSGLNDSHEPPAQESHLYPFGIDGSMLSKESEPVATTVSADASNGTEDREDPDSSQDEQAAWEARETAIDTLHAKSAAAPTSALHNGSQTSSRLSSTENDGVQKTDTWNNTVDLLSDTGRDDQGGYSSEERELSQLSPKSLEHMRYEMKIEAVEKQETDEAEATYHNEELEKEEEVHLQVSSGSESASVALSDEPMAMVDGESASDVVSKTSTSHDIETVDSQIPASEAMQSIPSSHDQNETAIGGPVPTEDPAPTLADVEAVHASVDEDMPDADAVRRMTPSESIGGIPDANILSVPEVEPIVSLNAGSEVYDLQEPKLVDVEASVQSEVSTSLPTESEAPQQQIRPSPTAVSELNKIQRKDLEPSSSGHEKASSESEATSPVASSFRVREDVAASTGSPRNQSLVPETETQIEYPPLPGLVETEAGIEDKSSISQSVAEKSKGVATVVDENVAIFDHRKTVSEHQTSTNEQDTEQVLETNGQSEGSGERVENSHMTSAESVPISALEDDGSKRGQEVQQGPTTTPRQQLPGLPQTPLPESRTAAVDVPVPEMAAPRSARQSKTEAQDEKSAPSGRRSVSARVNEVPSVISAWFSPRRSSRLIGMTPEKNDGQRKTKALASSPARITRGAGAGSISPPPLGRVEAQGTLTSLSYFHPLTAIAEQVNQPGVTVDVLAISASDSSQPTRAKGGPRDFYTVFHVIDSALHDHNSQSSAHGEATSGQAVRVEVYRPWKASLPATSLGDVVLLRNFIVRSQKHKPYLLSSEASSWCVWRYSESAVEVEEEGDSDKPMWARKRKNSIKEEIKGPPVDVGSEERHKVNETRDWWESLQAPGKDDEHGV